MTKLEKEVLKFLLSASVYSENAIIKNFGINEYELKTVFDNLTKEGYLEDYTIYLEREGLNENNCCKSLNKTRSCSCKNSCCEQNAFSKIEDYSKIKILTKKAINLNI